MKLHKYCGLLPRMVGDEFQALKADITWVFRGSSVLMLVMSLSSKTRICNLSVKINQALLGIGANSIIS